jgi:hypothetical protein
MTRSKKQKLYAYVDESGQDSKGQIFIVSVVVVGQRRDELRKKLRAIERTSNKKLRKWKKSRPHHREAYIRQVIESGMFTDAIYFAHYKDTRTYVDLTVLSIAKAINHVASPPYETSIFIDGLKKTERMFFGSSLRKLNIKVRKVRGLRDESDEFIRLADAIAGFVRDCLEKDPKMKDLYEQALKSKVIQEI